MAINESKSNLTITAEWTPLPVFTLTIACISLVLNGLALLLFAFHNKLHTPFNVYLINLLFANVLYSLIDSPLEVTNEVYSSWWLSDGLCTMYMYGQWIISLTQQNTHALIAMNRFWAIVFPLSYKQNHRLPTALFLCAGAWVLAHAVALPMVLLNPKYYGTAAAEDGCHIYTLGARGQVVWLVVNQFFCCVDVLIILAVLPFVLYKRYRHSFVRVGADPGSRTNESIPKEGYSQKTSVAVITGNPHIAAPQVVEQHSLRNRHKKSSHGLLLLVLLTISVSICWAPCQIVFTIIPFMDVFSAALQNIVSCLYNLQAAIDPVLFTLAVKDVRDTLMACFR